MVWTHGIHQVEFCRLAGLPDLDQENSYVANTLTAWIQNTVETYGFDGIRIDTVPEVCMSERSNADVKHKR